VLEWVIVRLNIMKTVYEERNEFGGRLRELRTNAGHSLRDIDKATGITYSLVSCIERGERAVGSDIAVKLADGLQLHGEARSAFLLQAAATRKKDRLLGYARTLAPEILNYVAKALVDAGIDLATIEACELKDEKLLLELRGGRNLTCTLSMTATG
jgi:transcriptional regulator with XRE-family HTH domain